MTHRLIDLSVPLRADIASDPPYMLPQIDYVDHHQSAPAIAAYFGVARRPVARRPIRRDRELPDQQP